MRVPFFATPVSFSKHWSLLSLNGRETVSSLIVNSHHASHIMYGYNGNDLFAIVTFKENKGLDQVKELYGGDVLAEALPRAVTLEGLSDCILSDDDIVRNNRNFMMSNFEVTVEIN
jgi:hypothetical protein